MNNQELFKIFTDKKNDFDLYESVITFVNKEKEKTKIEIHEYYSSVLTKLINSINNAGHEDRRSNDISFINQELYKIHDIIDK